MSTIRALNAGAPGAGTTTELMPSLAKAWANINGGATSSVTKSFNISSLTKLNTGRWTFTFTSAMMDADFKTGWTVGTSVGGTSDHSGLILDSVPATTTTVSTSAQRASFFDVNSGMLDTFGDLA